MSSDTHNTDTDSTTSSNRFSLANQVKEGFEGWIITLRRPKPMGSIKWRIFHTLTELYILYCALFIPTLRNYAYGEYGQIIYRVLNFPMHFLLDWIQYEHSFIVIGLFMVFLVVAYALLIVTSWSFSKGKGFGKNLQTLLFIIMGVCRMLFPLFVHQVIGYLDCSMTNHLPYTTTNTLNRYISNACDQHPNNILIGISTTFIVLLLLFVVISEIVCSDMHPQSRHIFSHANFWSMVILRMCCFVSIVLMFVIPIEFAYISCIVNIITSLIATVTLFKTIPFYRTITNSIVFGIYCGALAGSCGTIISFFVNSQFTSLEDLFGGVGAGLSVMIVLFTLGGFGLGLTGLELYQRFIRRVVLAEILECIATANNIRQGFDEDNGESTATGNYLGGANNQRRVSVDTSDYGYQQFMSSARATPKQYRKGLLLLMRLDLIDQTITNDLQHQDMDGRGQAPSIHEIVIRLSKIILQRGIEDREILETVAMIFAYRHTGTSSSLTIAVELLTKSQKLANFFTHTFSSLKITEIQSVNEANKSDGIISRGYSKIQLIKKNSELILALHKDFFKELMNDPIKISTIKIVTKKISELTQETEAVFKQLLSRKTKKLLIMYASFVELVYFDKETAHSLYVEANALEEHKVTTKQQQQHHKLYNKTTKIIPTNSSRDELSEEASFQKVSSSFYSDNESSHQQLDEILEESTSVAGGELKKEFLFRNALKTTKSNTSTTSFYALFLLLGVFILFGSIALSIYQGAIIKKNIINLRLICVPQISPISTIRNLRSFQNWVNMFALTEYKWPTKRHGYLNEIVTKYIESHIEVLEEDTVQFQNLVTLGHSAVFDASTYTAYGKSQHLFKVPSVNGTSNNSWSKKQFTGIPEERTVSIIELTNSFLQSLEEMKTSLPMNDLARFFNSSNPAVKLGIQERLMNSSLLNPINDFNFMLLWINMQSSSNDLQEFCTDTMTKSNDQAKSMISHFEYYFIATLVCYIILGLVFVTFLQYDLTFISRLIRVYDKQIGKDVIGKVYQTISKKTETEASLRMSIFSQFMRGNISVILVVIVISLVIPLCVGLMFYESRTNIKNAMFTYTNVALSSGCLRTLQMSSFYLTELLTYFALPNMSYDLKNIKYGHPYFKEYDFVGIYAEIRNQVNSLSANFNELIYGDVTKPDNDPVIGLYPVLDALLVDVSNCTLHLEQRQLELTYENYLENCAGIENIVTQYLTKTTQVSELTRDHYIEQLKYPSKLVDPLELYLLHNDLYRMSIPMTKKLQVYMQEFVRVSSELSIGITVGFSIFGCSCIAVLGYILFRIMNNYWDSLQKTRMMLNYIALENIDRNEILRNLVLYHSYPNVILDSMNNESNKQEIQSNLSSLNEMINRHIDGTILINPSGDIESMNNAAHRMFGSKSSDFLGAPFYKLFDEKRLQSVKKVFESILESEKKSSNGTTSIDNNRNITETLEVECTRLNQTKFPSKISFFSMNIVEKGLIVACTIKDITSETKQKALLEEEKKNSEALLKNILPEAVAARLKKGETFIAEHLNDITCFFSDMVGFTKISNNMQATELVKMLNFVVNGFDKLTEKYDLEKIKTIGDAYFVVGGLRGSSDHPENMLRFAIETFDVIKEFNQGGHLKEGVFLNIRIGINTGGCVAGVIGIKKFAYDLWGDTINTSSRMESTGVPGRVQISRATYERVHDLGLEFEERRVAVKGIGNMQAYLLNDKHHSNPVDVSHSETTIPDYGTNNNVQSQQKEEAAEDNSPMP